jgi:hypothetical protein
MEAFPIALALVTLLFASSVFGQQPTNKPVFLPLPDGPIFARSIGQARSTWHGPGYFAANSNGQSEAILKRAPPFRTSMLPW